ncbi:hypothetical protein EUX98_g3189 [Antrodiella citrinella]|uniref:Uncharacterized protein n=1 Tax=Antrodiella citrinella TaxID=2447956 RepID=A0A4V3XIY7_9APHY|nr:hypothetical protein EUX98_g3189 [Antrodiella citrinella]
MLLYHQIFAILIQALVATLLIVRTYALYNRDRKILGLMKPEYVFGQWAVLTPHGPTPPQPIGVGCNVNLSDLQGIFAWSIMLLFDCLIFGLTLVRAICLSRTVRRTLFDIMLRDGTMYFACMAGANLGNIVTFLVCPPGLKGVPTTFTNVYVYRNSTLHTAI